MKKKRVLPEASLANLRWNTRLGSKKFIERSRESFGDRYDYALTAYGDTYDDPITVRCTIHDEMVTVTARHHLNSKNGGCKKCRGKAISDSVKVANRKRADAARQPLLVRAQLFVQDSMERFESKFSYKYITALNFGTGSVPLVCLKHDKLFVTSPRYHLNSVTGCCPVCIQNARFAAGQAGKGISRKRKAK